MHLFNKTWEWMAHRFFPRSVSVLVRHVEMALWSGPLSLFYMGSLDFVV